MNYITPQQMIAFHDELQMQKEAWLRGAGKAVGSALKSGYQTLAGSPRLRQGIRLGATVLPHRYGGQVALGAGTGAVAGGLTAEKGQGMSGALKGALLGTGIAGGRILATAKGRQALGGSLSNFGQRQRYGLTGSFGKKVGKTKQEQLAHAQKIGLVPKKVDPKSEQFTSIKDKPGLYERAKSGITGKAPVDARAKAIAKAQESQGLGQHAFEQGYMNVPGIAKGLASRRAGDLIRTGWKRGGAVGKGFAGLGAYETGKGLIEKPREGGPGRLEKGLRGAAGTLGWMVAPHTLLASSVAGMGSGALGGAVGKLGDRGVRALRRPGRVSPPPSRPQYGGR